jgi:hypothetical protein
LGLPVRPPLGPAVGLGCDLVHRTDATRGRR